MDKMRKQAQTPKETAQALDRMADRLEEMDSAEGAFGEAMSDALPDKYLDEVVGGLAAIVITSGGPTKHFKVCTQCGDGFNTYNAKQDLCDKCLHPKERK